jgi:hypothetical protein
MPKVLIVRADGAAFLQETEQFEDGSHSEGGTRLRPNDIVDGVPIRDWPVGVHTISSLESRIGDWTRDTLEAENGEA